MSTCRNTIYQSGALPDAPLDVSSQVELSSAAEVWEDLTGDGALSRVTIGSLASVVDSVMFLQSRILYVGSQVTERTSTVELWSCFEVGAALPPMINTLPNSSVEIASYVGMSDVQLPFLSSSTTVGSSVLSLIQIPIPSIPRHEAFYLINSTTGAVSTIATEATHIAAKDGVLYASSGESLLAFTGAPATVTIAFGNMKLANGGRMTAPRIVPLLSSDGPVEALFTVSDDGDEFSDGPFLVTAEAAPKLREWPTSIGRGHRGNTYSFTFRGAILSLDALSVQVEALSRDK